MSRYQIKGWLISFGISILLLLLVVGAMEIGEQIMFAFWWCLLHHTVFYCAAVFGILLSLTQFFYVSFVDEDEDE